MFQPIALYVDGGPSTTGTTGHVRMNGREVFRHAVTALPFGKWGTIIYMQIILIVLGMFLDWIGIGLLQATS